MLEIRAVRKSDFEDVTEFIALLNNSEESHIGYCGKDKEEIVNYRIEIIAGRSRENLG